MQRGIAGSPVMSPTRAIVPDFKWPWKCRRRQIFARFRLLSTWINSRLLASFILFYFQFSLLQGFPLHR